MSFLPQPGESLENNDPIESSDEENDDLRLDYIYHFWESREPQSAGFSKIICFVLDSWAVFFLLKWTSLCRFLPRYLKLSTTGSYDETENLVRFFRLPNNIKMIRYAHIRLNSGQNLFPEIWTESKVVPSNFSLWIVFWYVLISSKNSLLAEICKKRHDCQSRVNTRWYSKKDFLGQQQTVIIWRWVRKCFITRRSEEPSVTCFATWI